MFILVLGFVNAQDLISIDEDQSSEYKQSAGDKNLELQFNPGAIFATGGNVFSNPIGVTFRLFRIGFLF